MKPPVFTIDGKKVSYVPMEDLIESMRQNLNMPYKSEFSFHPLLHKMHVRVESTGCEMTATMAPRVEELEKALCEQNGEMTDELREAVDGLTKMLLPAMYFEGEYGFVSPPFMKEFVYGTPAMQELMDKNKWLVKVQDDFLTKKEYGNLQNAAAAILNRFYGQNIDLSIRDNLTFRNMETGRERHLRLDIREDYMDIEVVGELRHINEEEMNYLLNNFKNDEVVLEYLPVESFKLKGMGIGVFNDVSDLEIQSIIKDSVLNVSNIPANEFIGFLEQQLNDYMDRQDIKVGMADLIFQHVEDGFQMSLTEGRDFRGITEEKFDNKSCYPYLEAYCSTEPVIVPDLHLLPVKSEYEEALTERGFRSLILIPLADNHGRVTSLVEIASRDQYAFNVTNIKKLRPIIELLSLGNEVFLSDFNNKIERFIKSKFTAIHPSVEWKFEEIATYHEVQKELSGVEDEIESVVFRDVYPLYGQVDIRNSSEIRNNAIQEDLINNLEKVIEVIGAYQNFIEFHLLDAFKIRAEKSLEKFRAGYTSSHESSVVELLTREIHPLLEHLQDQFPEIPGELLNDYDLHLDDELGIVNKSRKQYEKSVNKLNKVLSEYLELENEKLQQVLPHYFEKYKTDGVEYNIYLGQSLLKNAEFSNFHLRDFRLWQLVKTVEMTNLVAGLKPKLKIPLDTSQLIFVYNSPMSIQFRMDEKRFDVEGSYNVRYEILKKRIDKAVIKGTKERLSASGKIAIVYLLDKDREEYMSYIEYLIDKGMIDKNVEDLELEKLQGAEGLRALRVTVQ